MYVRKIAYGGQMLLILAAWRKLSRPGARLPDRSRTGGGSSSAKTAGVVTTKAKRAGSGAMAGGEVLRMTPAKAWRAPPKGKAALDHRCARRVAASGLERVALSGGWRGRSSRRCRPPLACPPRWFELRRKPGRVPSHHLKIFSVCAAILSPATLTSSIGS